MRFAVAKKIKITGAKIKPGTKKGFGTKGSTGTKIRPGTKIVKGVVAGAGGS